MGYRSVDCPEMAPRSFRMTVDYLSVNAVPMKNTWAMPLVDAVLQDICDAQACVAIDFISSYFLLPMHPNG